MGQFGMGKANFVAKYLTQCAIKKAMILNDNVKADLTLRASDHLQSIVQIWPKICTVRNFNSFPVQLRPTFFELKGNLGSWIMWYISEASMLVYLIQLFCFRMHSVINQNIWIK